MGSEHVSGRPVWVIQLEPMVQGKLFQRLWIDKQTGVVLCNKRYRPNGDYVVLSRYNEFKTDPSFEQSLFLLHSLDEAEDHYFAPDFLSQSEIKSHLPARLPHGFEFESMDTFLVDGRNVDHARYTDGVSVLSIFETSKPVRARNEREERMNAHASMANFQKGNQHYMVLGDVSKDLLEDILTPLK